MFQALQRFTPCATEGCARFVDARIAGGLCRACRTAARAARVEIDVRLPEIDPALVAAALVAAVLGDR